MLMNPHADALAQFPTGVVVVTATAADGAPAGMLSGSFTTVAADPPLVAFPVRADSAEFARLRTAASFCVNVLAADQEHLGRRFSGTGPGAFDGVPWHPAPSGAPVLAGVVSWLDCDFAGVNEHGDHYIVLGAVTGARAERDVLPLLHFQQGYGTFSPGSLVSAEQGPGRGVTLAETGRDIIDLLARELGVECSVLIAADGETVVVATAKHSTVGRPTRLGYRIPITPPLGTLFVGHRGAPGDEEWLDAIPPGAPPRARDFAREQLARARRRGWSISLHDKLSVTELDEIVERYARPQRTGEDERRLLGLARQMAPKYEVGDLADDEFYDVIQLSAPVRSPSGEVVAVLRLGSLPARADGAEVMFWVTRLREAAAAFETALRSPAYAG
jgi:flavin reductase (DIM6/NTAB) family NADH-FMN oxidoreductase RutF/DNA-binding IclR family transcriptional regulator